MPMIIFRGDISLLVFFESSDLSGYNFLYCGFTIFPQFLKCFSTTLSLPSISTMPSLMLILNFRLRRIHLFNFLPRTLINLLCRNKVVRKCKITNWSLTCNFDKARCREDNKAGAITEIFSGPIQT